MKIFTNKNLIQKLVIAIVAITLLNFCMAPRSQAAKIGGTLFKPMKEFLTTVGDVFMSLLYYGVTGDWIDSVDEKGSAEFGDNVDSDFWEKANKIRYPIIQLSPELIFSNKIEMLDIDFISKPSGDSSSKYLIPAGNGARAELRNVIASWYVTLRTIAIVGLLSVLIYIGIRIIISSTSQDRAKYKQRLMDWVVAFVLLFFMHYIMSVTINVVGKVDNLLATGTGIGSGIQLDQKRGNIKYTPKDDVYDENIDSGVMISKVNDWFTSHGFTLDSSSPVVVDLGGQQVWFFVANGKEQIKMTYDSLLDGWHAYEIVDSDISSDQLADINSTIGSVATSSVSADVTGSGTGETSWVTFANGNKALVSTKSLEDGSKILYYINYARLYINAKSSHIDVAFGFLILYIILIVWCGMFMFRYVKRVIYVAFLTLIAPLVALTYPIDKIKDRKSTGV